MKKAERAQPQTNGIFLEVVPDRSAKTLMPILERHIAPGTLIVSDSWPAYNGITFWKGVSPWEHLTVNHHKEFVNSATGAHTQKIERLWREFKEKKKRGQGIRRVDGQSYSGEFVLRHQWKVAGIDRLEGAARPFSETQWDMIRKAVPAKKILTQ